MLNGELTEGRASASRSESLRLAAAARRRIAAGAPDVKLPPEAHQLKRLRYKNSLHRLAAEVYLDRERRTRIAAPVLPKLKVAGFPSLAPNVSPRPWPMANAL
jgi:hypothetical protein